MNKQNIRHIAIALLMTLAGLLLAAAAIDPGLPTGYWDNPSASPDESQHHWSVLEKDLSPEACAQCHSSQFNSWKKSLHADAYSSGLIGQFPAMGHVEGNNCLECHAPLQEQKYRNQPDMNQSIALKLKHGDGFDIEGELGGKELPLRHSGVSCAVCHVRGGKRFGPPPKNSAAVGVQKGAAHGGFTATRAFEQSQFCASCHQFPQSMAINGKPLENTLVEWKQSTFSKKGVTCQQCHMPDRRHEFRGIHDAEMVRKGLEFKLRKSKDSVIFTMISTWIGHAFPTYVTPKVIVLADALDRDGKSLRQWRWEIVREVEYDNGWQEKRDTRLMPGERRDFIASPLPEKALRVRYRVTVIPDHFYKGIYQGLLADQMTANARTHIRKASAQANRNDYLLYQQELDL
ncbi:MAG: multiheme c-type cytochrome [Mariprofundus sp.]